MTTAEDIPDDVEVADDEGEPSEAPVPAAQQVKRTPPPAPGIYEGVSFGEYALWDAYNWSALKWCDWSLARFKAVWDEASDDETADTVARREGRLLHALVLEPGAAATRWTTTPATYPVLTAAEGSDLVVRRDRNVAGGVGYTLSRGRGKAKHTWTARLVPAGADGWDVVAPDGADRGELVVVSHPWYATATFARAWSASMAEKGVSIVPRDVMDRCRAMAEKVRAVPDVAALLDGAQTEVSLVWRDAETGLTCKARLDALKVALIADIKTCARPVGDNDLWAAVMLAWNYHGQAAMYCDGLIAALAAQGKKLDIPATFTFIAIEKFPRYHCQPWELATDTGTGSYRILACGRQRWRAHLKSVAYALKTGIWPGGRADLDDALAVPTCRELFLPDYMEARLKPADTFGANREAPEPGWLSREVEECVQ